MLCLSMILLLPAERKAVADGGLPDRYMAALLDQTSGAQISKHKSFKYFSPKFIMYFLKKYR